LSDVSRLFINFVEYYKVPDLRFLTITKNTPKHSAATKSFYGIRSIRIVSSERWKTDNHFLALCIGLAVAISIAITFYINEEKFISRSSSILSNIPYGLEQKEWQNTEKDASGESILLVGPSGQEPETVE